MVMHIEKSIPTVLLSSLRTWSVASQCCQMTRESRRLLQTSAEGSSSSTNHSANPFPYPTSRNPTPHQLFHLPPNATKSDIKARYYDLVRLYHPDKVGDTVSPDDAHARFQAITAAYDVLRGKTALRDSLGSSSTAATGTQWQTTAAYRAARRQRQELYDSGAVDDSRKDKLILFGVVMTIIIVFIQTATTRREVLAEAAQRQRLFSANARHNRQAQEEQRLSQNYGPEHGSSKTAL